MVEPASSILGVLEGRFCLLTPVTPEYLPFLYSLLMEEGSGYPWRYRGYTPPFEKFAAELNNDMFAHFVIIDAQEMGPVGYVGGYKLDLRSGHGHILVSVARGHRRSVISSDASLRFLDFAFRQWPLRKMYLERPAFIGHLASLKRYADHESTLPEHIFYDGKYYDLWICSISREVAGELISRFQVAHAEPF
jgi:RimJ/RimL family protein N-acetyltransferase